MLNAAKEAATRDKLHSTKGGVSDTELNELAVSPTKLPSAARAVTMVTPVANMPRAERKSLEEKTGAVAWREIGCTGEGEVTGVSEGMKF